MNILKGFLKSNEVLSCKKYKNAITLIHISFYATNDIFTQHGNNQLFEVPRCATNDSC